MFESLLRMRSAAELRFKLQIFGLYRDNGKENGNYYNGVKKGLGFRVMVYDLGL